MSARILARAGPDDPQLRRRLYELEKHCVALRSDSTPQTRQTVWQELADLQERLANVSEAAICWANALWDVDLPPPWAGAWVQLELQCPPADVGAADVDRLLENQGARPAALAAYLIWASGQDPVPSFLSPRRECLLSFLEQREPMLSVRSIWLVWTALVRCGLIDPALLPPVRLRLLQRLYSQGLNPGVDVPGFLRFFGTASGESIRRILQLHALARCWIRPNPLKPEARTGAYVDLIFAFGLARLGERPSCQRLVQAAQAQLNADEVHSFLFQAYHHRIQQALEGKPHAGPLPTEQLEYLETRGRDLPKMHSEQQKRARYNIYKIDRLRQGSDILDPHEKIQPYRRFFGHILGELEQELALLFDVSDRQELAARLNRLVQSSAGKPPATRATVLETALELSPRVSEALALDLLKRVLPLLAQLTEPEAQAGLLEKALVVAAHFDQGDLVQAFVAAFHRLLEAQQKDPALARLRHSLVGQCFKGLRKLGLRDEIDWLLRRTAELVLQGEDLEGVHRRLQKTAGTSGALWLGALGALRTLLHIAGGWFYFGQDDQARRVLDLVRDILLEGNLQPWQQTEVACAYASALSHAPVEEALRRAEELFQKLERVRDSFSTNTHYSLSELRLVEAVVMALTSDEFTAGGGVRRWLEDDEYLVRQRIRVEMNPLFFSLSDHA